MSRDRSLHLGSAFCCAAVLVFSLFLTPTFGNAAPCTVPDNGSGTVFLPPPGCGYLSPADVHEIINGLPPGTTVEVAAQHSDFFNISHSPGGSLGGEVENFQSALILTLTGTGGMSGYSRNATIQTVCETHTAPRAPGQPVQSFDTDMFRIQGQLPPGDPDFDLLRITAGTGFGLPSPGHTTLTRLPNGDWNIDSFFDITYRIDFVGKAGGPFSGMSGSTTATIRMKSGEPVPPPCTVVDNGSGTVNLPPAGCGYVSPNDLHEIINGLPPGTTITVGAEHNRFFNVTHTPGGSLGGEVEQFQSSLTLDLSGTGSLGGYHRDLSMQANCETHTGPRVPGQPVQSFDTDMFRIQGQLPPGDPDFDLLRITAGTGFGMPSPGHTTLTRLGTSSNWNVDSFFDITYRIDFVGKPGGPLGGMSGSTTGTIRMQSGNPSGDVGVPIDVQAGDLKLSNRPNPFGQGTSIEYRLPAPAAVNLAIFNAAGQAVRTLTKANLPAGPHAMYWDGRNDEGKKLKAGVYFIKIVLDGKVTSTRRATLLR